MIIDAAATLVFGLWEWVLGLLPDGDPVTWPGISAFVQTLANIDTLVPVLPVVYVAMGMLSGLLIFIVIRVVLVIINIVWW